MKFTYTLSPEDVITFRKEYFRKHKPLFFIFGGLGLMVALSIIVNFVEKGTFEPVQLIFPGSILLLVFIFSSQISKKRLLSNELTRSIFHPKNIEITPEHYICKCDCGEHKLPWKKFSHYRENELYFFAFINSKCGVIFPKEKSAPPEYFSEALKFMRRTLKDGSKEETLKKDSGNRNRLIIAILIFLIALAVGYYNQQGYFG